MAGEVRRTHVAKKMHPDMEFLLQTNIVHVRDASGEGKDHCEVQIHRQKPLPGGALLTLFGSSSQEAGMSRSLQSPLPPP